MASFWAGLCAVAVRVVASPKKLFRRLFMLPELTEDQQIENLGKFLQKSEEVIRMMKENGATAAVINQAIMELQVAPALAQRNALIVERLKKIQGKVVMPLEIKTAEVRNPTTADDNLQK